jgi:hypothetical protein
MKTSIIYLLLIEHLPSRVKSTSFGTSNSATQEDIQEHNQGEKDLGRQAVIRQPSPHG